MAAVRFSVLRVLIAALPLILMAAEAFAQRRP
jgi:hypothetical protein